MSTDKSSAKRDPHGVDSTSPHVVSVADKNQQLAANLVRILALFESTDPSLNQIAQELKKHEEVARDVLTNVNSAGLGLKHNVKHVEHAVAILGQQRTLRFLKEQISRRSSEIPGIATAARPSKP